MREIHLNGYIDEEEWFGDEITPEALHGMLYPEGEEAHGDLRIFLNSYGGSCNAAVRMFDDLRAYPGNVHIIVSGTAASAATVLAMAADRLARLSLEKRTGFPLGAGAPQTTWLDEKELTERFLCEVVSLIHVHEMFSDALEQETE